MALELSWPGVRTPYPHHIWWHCLPPERWHDGCESCRGAASSPVAVGNVRARVRPPKEKSIGSAAAWFWCHLPKEGRASPTTVARAHQAGCLRDGPSANAAGACGDVGLSPVRRPRCFPWCSVWSPALARLCHPQAPQPWRSYSPSLCLGSPTRCKPPQNRRGKATLWCANSAQRCPPRFRDALGGLADSVAPVCLQDGLTAHFGCAVARTASIPAPKRVRGCKRGCSIAPGTVGRRGMRSLRFLPVTLIC